MLEWSDLYAVIDGNRKFTPKERDDVIERTDRAGEGSYNINELKKYSDAELAKACISAENDYAISQL